jgi:ABC-type branched-subunit amino acid transport system substrate-binding protein
MTQQDTTATAFIQKLTQLGVKLKASLIPTGYTETTLTNKADNAALQGQGFSVQMVPVEANTPGAKAFKAALDAYGYVGPPSYSAEIGWMTGWELQAGLAKFGKPNPTKEQFITALRSVTNFDADGALAPEQINFSHYNNKYSCLWMVKLEGTAFVSVPGSPFCGTATSDVK